MKTQKTKAQKVGHNSVKPCGNTRPCERLSWDAQIDRAFRWLREEERQLEICVKTQED